MISAASLLNSYDPANPSSIDSSLTGAGLSDSYYAQGANGTSAAPGTESPVTVPLVTPTPSATAATGSGPNVYQQALSSLSQWSDQTLIESALGGSSADSSGTSTDDSSSVTSSLEQAAEAQASTQAAQQQAALAAANSALTAGTNVDTTA